MYIYIYIYVLRGFLIFPLLHMRQFHPDILMKIVHVSHIVRGIFALKRIRGNGFVRAFIICAFHVIL